MTPAKLECELDADTASTAAVAAGRRRNVAVALTWASSLGVLQGFTIDTSYSREANNWSAAFRVHETPDPLIFTRPGPQSLHPPRAAFPSAEAFADDLRATIRGTV